MERTSEDCIAWQVPLCVGRVGVAALFALVKYRLTLIHGAHLHRVKAHLWVLTLGARLLNLREEEWRSGARAKRGG